MARFFKLIGVVVLLAFMAGAGLWADLVWNGSRVFYALAGRDRLEQACRPLAMESLIGKGFTPIDLIFGAMPSISFAAGPQGSSRTLTGGFTFSDGPEGQRVDGTLVCMVSGHSVKVDVDVDQLPERAT